MIQMTVANLGVDTAKSAPFVVLTDPNRIRALLLWVGAAEAYAISNAMKRKDEKQEAPHQLMLAAIELLGYKLTRVVIDKVENKVYSATLELASEKSTKSLKTRIRTMPMEARASDAIALAIYAGAPIVVAPAILTNHAVPFDPDQEQEERDAFCQFIANINASDFKIDKRIA